MAEPNPFILKVCLKMKMHLHEWALICECVVKDCNSCWQFHARESHLPVTAFTQNFQQLKAFRPDLLGSLVHTVLWNFKLLTVIHVTGKNKQTKNTENKKLKIKQQYHNRNIHSAFFPQCVGLNIDNGNSSTKADGGITLLFWGFNSWLREMSMHCWGSI